jgi:hypothetical protein
MPPELIPMEGEWPAYCEQIYDVFRRQVIEGDLRFDGLPVRPFRNPMTDGKWMGFWHAISEGRVEADRLPDMRRCERIAWISWAVSNASTDPELCWWPTARGTLENVVIWSEPHDYVVVLGKKRNWYAFITQYHVDRSNRRRDLARERDAYREQAAAVARPRT